MRLLIALLAAVTLSGCAGMFTAPGEIPVSQTLSAPAKAAQSAVNESNVLIAAAANVIAQNLADGIVTKAEAQKQLDQLKAYTADVDRAQKLLDSGDILGAQNQAELARKLIVALHREVAKRRVQ